MNEIQRYEANQKYSFYGCVVMATVVLVVLVAIVAVIMTSMYAVTDMYHTHSTVSIARINTDGAVSMARLQAQDHITVACMEHSWFTSMTSCIRAGGVNGTGWDWWQWVLLTIGVWVALMWWNGRGNGVGNGRQLQC